jgi:hypothetical protein
MNNPCPKCHQQWTQQGPIEPTECPKCGVIFAKFYAAQEQKRRLEEERAAQAKAEAEARAAKESKAAAKAAAKAQRQTKNAKVATAAPAEDRKVDLVSTCPACGGTVAIGAKACPHCGKDNPAPAPKKAGKGKTVFALLLLLAILYSIGSNQSGGGSSAARYDAFNAQVECEKFVSSRLKAPSSASFASFSELRISGSGDGPWTVIGWVDAANAFGAKLRKPYVCEVQFADNRVKLLSLSID